MAVSKETKLILDKIDDLKSALTGPKQASPIAVRRLEAMRRHPNNRGDNETPESNEAVIGRQVFVDLELSEDGPVQGVASVLKSGNGMVRIDIRLNSVEGDRLLELLEIAPLEALRMVSVKP